MACSILESQAKREIWYVPVFISECKPWLSKYETEIHIETEKATYGLYLNQVLPNSWTTGRLMFDPRHRQKRFFL